MRRIILFMALTILLIGIASAEIQFYQEKLDMGNGTIQNHLTIFYEKSGSLTADNYVSGNNLYEVYLLYNLYPQKWNTDNPNYKVDKCNLIIQFSGHRSSPIMVINQSYTDADSDIMGGKYFMKLNDGDGMIVDEICYFKDKNYHELDIPAEMQIVTPSWECKACQYYEWSVREADVVKAKSIGSNVVTISDYIKKLFMLNFEIWLSLFWIFLILMIFVAIGFIFLIGYWLFIYIKNLVK